MKKRTCYFILFIALELLSFYLFSKGSWTINNLSMVGNLLEYRLLYYLWALLFIFAFYIPLMNIKVSKRSLLYQIQTQISLISFILSVILPFDVNSADLLSMLHIPLAAVSLFSILASLLYLITLIKEEYPHYYFSLIRKTEMILSVLSVSILIFSQINSIVECLFITLTVPLIHKINYIFKE